MVRVFPEECPPLRKWAETHAPVFFGLGETSALWYLIPKSSDGMSYVAKILRTDFVEILRGGTQRAKDLEFLMDLGKHLSGYGPKHIHNSQDSCVRSPILVSL